MIKSYVNTFFFDEVNRSAFIAWTFFIAGRPSVYFFNALSMPRTASSVEFEAKSEDSAEAGAAAGHDRKKFYSTW
jgi:hypothetical protein